MASELGWYAFAGVVVLVLVSPLLLYIIVRWTMFARRQRREAAARAAANEVEAGVFLGRVAAEGLKTVWTDLVLGAGEHALLVDAATLYETRSYRIYAGAGTSIKGVHVGGGRSWSEEELRRIDAGTLVLTNKRLVFDGGVENRAIKLSDIVSAAPLADAIEVSTQKRGKSLIFTVPNPLIWAPIVKAVASGPVEIRE
jgi:hypothetical protein